MPLKKIKECLTDDKMILNRPNYEISANFLFTLQWIQSGNFPYKSIHTSIIFLRLRYLISIIQGVPKHLVHF